MTPLLNVKEAAAYLNVSEMTIYRLVKAGTLPNLRVGHGIRFMKDALDEYLTNPAPTKPTVPAKNAPVTRL